MTISTLSPKFQVMYIERILKDRLLTLFRSFPVVVISGARQVGKSTLVQKVFPEADYTVFDPVTDVENARQDPELFLNNHKTPIILDEIQYAPELLPAIKRRIDNNKKPGMYILTGSQQWGVMKNISESLAGRAVFLDLDGFCLAEISEAIEGKSWLWHWLNEQDDFISRKPSRLKNVKPLYEQIWRGWLPEPQFLDIGVIPDYYQSYIRTYIERDTRLMADISDFQLYGKFIRLSAALSGQEINYSQLGRELGLTPKTSARWIDILYSTFQWFELPAYSGNAIKRISGKPKGYIADTGLLCAAQVISAPNAIGGHPLRGALFETAVISEIRKLSSILSPSPNMYHWRSHGGAEVDLVLEINGTFYPVEIKAASNPGKNDLSGINAFRKTYPDLRIAKGLVIAPCERFIQLSNEDYALPWDTEWFR